MTESFDDASRPPQAPSDASRRPRAPNDASRRSRAPNDASRRSRAPSDASRRSQTPQDLPPEDERLVAGIRQQLDRSCNALDGQTLSRLNRIRHEALERKQTRGSRMLLPFGGFVTASVLVLSVTLFRPGSPEPDVSTGASPLEDIEILTSSDSLDLYEDYDFYQWLAENDSPV